MDYTFSWSAFFAGMIIMVIGAIFTVYHQKIADTMGSGMSDYDRYKLAGVIACAVGLVVALNLVNIILSFLVGSLFNLNSNR